MFAPDKGVFADRVKSFEEETLGEPQEDDPVSVALFLRMLEPRKLQFELRRSDRHDLEMGQLIADFAAKRTGEDTDEKHKLRTVNHLNIRKHMDRSEFMSLAPDLTVWGDRWLDRMDTVVDPVVRTAMATHHRTMAEVDQTEGWLLALSYERKLSLLIRQARHLRFRLLKHSALAEARSALALAKKRVARK